MMMSSTPNEDASVSEARLTTRIPRATRRSTATSTRQRRPRLEKKKLLASPKRKAKAKAKAKSTTKKHTTDEGQETKKRPFPDSHLVRGWKDFLAEVKEELKGKMKHQEIMKVAAVRPGAKF